MIRVERREGENDRGKMNDMREGENEKEAEGTEEIDRKRGARIKEGEGWGRRGGGEAEGQGKSRRSRN